MTGKLLANKPSYSGYYSIDAISLWVYTGCWEKIKKIDEEWKIRISLHCSTVSSNHYDKKLKEVGIDYTYKK